MGVTSYLTIDGEIISETRSGARADYLPDPLGSTRALTNSSQTITDTYFYWPYGEIRSHSGRSVTVYTFCGTLGYRADSIGYYVISRELELSYSHWLTVDYFWPIEFPWVYAYSNPPSFVDVLAYSPQKRKSGRKPPQVPSKPKPRQNCPSFWDQFSDAAFGVLHRVGQKLSNAGKILDTLGRDNPFGKIPWGLTQGTLVSPCPDSSGCTAMCKGFKEGLSKDYVAANCAQCCRDSIPVTTMGYRERIEQCLTRCDMILTGSVTSASAFPCKCKS